MDIPLFPSRSIMARLGLWKQNRQAKKQLVEYVVDAVEPKIRMARGYRKKLEQPIQICLEYCKSMVAGIPGPIHLQRNNYDADPLIHAAFMGSVGIEPLLIQQDTTFVSTIPYEPDRFALLTMAHRETTIFGPKVRGGMILGDVPMQSITFTDHKIVGLAATLELSQGKLEESCFHMILEAVSRELAGTRENIGELYENREKLYVLSRILSGRNHAKNEVVHNSNEDAEKLKNVQQMLQEAEGDLVHARQGNDTPQDWLEILIKHLSSPEKIMYTEPLTLRLDWKNVLTNDPEEKADNLTMMQFTLADKIKRDIVLISYLMEK